MDKIILSAQGFEQFNLDFYPQPAAFNPQQAPLQPFFYSYMNPFFFAFPPATLNA
ncbi:hypothetical protein [Acinetobacter sp. WCHAc010034]|uniref:hypothetical protein n=1 Tax=Acinetobacter sp. WCHAc010034 TaxID=1879049 RepID=UPI0013C30AB5|nr:hypothetical protein [Acinetobacter sp. WCHAc010034]